MIPFLRELKDFGRLLEESEAGRIEVAFYSERDFYFQYYADILVALKRPVHYITSDANDRTLRNELPNVHAFYIGNSLATAMAKLNARVVVMTMPDLDLFHIKRSPNVGAYVYVMHGLGSTFMTYREHALDAYDVILCVGDYMCDEIRRTEALHGLKAKRLVVCGYPWLEQLHRTHQARSGEPLVLAASSWGKHSILGMCAREIVQALSAVPHQCVLRPHPEFLKREAKAVEQLKKDVARHRNIKLELDLKSAASIHDADVLITDGSAIAFEYAMGTERPVLYLDLPPRVENPRWKEVGIEPVDISTRTRLGKLLPPGELGRLPQVIEELRRERDAWREQIVACRQEMVANWMTSAEVAAETIEALVS